MADGTSHYIRDLAKADGREYITPEDIQLAINNSGLSLDVIRMEVLIVLAEVGGYGAEDSGCCAFVAWKGEIDGNLDEE